jgi:hypothetical protein
LLLHAMSSDSLVLMNDKELNRRITTGIER